LDKVFDRNRKLVKKIARRHAGLAHAEAHTQTKDSIRSLCIKRTAETELQPQNGSMDWVKPHPHDLVAHLLKIV
jgi:hypothetical protein